MDSFTVIDYGCGMSIIYQGWQITQSEFWYQFQVIDLDKSYANFVSLCINVFELCQGCCTLFLVIIWKWLLSMNAAAQAIS